MKGSPSVAELFMHIHYVRLVFVSEDAPEFARELPEKEWVAERDPGRIRAHAERQRQGSAQSGKRPGAKRAETWTSTTTTRSSCSST